jgi:hypothetical protein
VITNYTTRTPKKCRNYKTDLVTPFMKTKQKTRKKSIYQPQARFELTTFRLLSECSTPKLLWRVHSWSDHDRIRSCPYGPMDKAPAYGAGDSGFESQYGLNIFLLDTMQDIFCTRLRRLVHGPPERISRYYPRHTLDVDLTLTTPKKTRQSAKGGDARIELATSCTRSRNHTTRPITL